MTELDEEEILEQLEENSESLKELGVERIGLFGSYVKGEQDSESDIDFLVEMEDISFSGYMDLKFFLEDLLGRDVDLVLEGDLKPSLEHVRDEAEYVTPA